MICKIKGVVQHYDWGGFELIPALLKQTNGKQQPWAEYWLGTHPKGPAVLEIDGEERELSVVLANHPEYLGDKVLAEFGALPFLFKILDVRQMLSIQLHPTIEKAKEGFAKEEAKGIPRLALNRNYKDQNHKPEVMVALTDFWLLHGFKKQDEITKILSKIPAWDSLLPFLENGGVETLYKEVMSMNQHKVDELLEPLCQQLKTNASKLSKDKADYWAWQAFQNYTRNGHYDRGIFSIYFFHLLRLKEGEGIFQDAGIPHAYLEGVNIELMANSDNVLRGGLTPKHIDVPELLDNVITDAVVPNVLQVEADENGVTHYAVPVNDFSLDKINLTTGKMMKIQQNGPAIYLLMSGDLHVNGIHYHSGEAFFASDGEQLELKAKREEGVVMFKAYA